MQPSRGAGRPSCLALNPRNREASAARRERLLAAFDSLPEDDRADLLEAVESIVFAHQVTCGGFHHADARAILVKAHEAAGWDAH